ncbi:MAG: replication factor C small subunit [Candidatus Methanomethylophilus sp.]|nr:replication factor C small subunit [Methanomethylophilus sp.]
MNEIWTEKYRPKTLDEVVGQSSVTDRLKGYVEAKNMPHLMFAGTPGTGKTTCALALARSMYGDSWRGNFIELNASDDRGIDVVRGKIKDFARTAPIEGAEFKIIFLDESDALTNDAQGALRRTMEKYSKTCRFILSCNYSSKIIDPIQSRCAVFRFRPVSNAEIQKVVDRIAAEENLDMGEGAVESLIYIARGDVRRAVNTLQTAASLGEQITPDTIAKVSGSANEDEITDILKSAMMGKFNDACNKLDNVMITYGLSGQDIIRQIHAEISKLGLPIESKVKLIDKTGEIEFRIIEGSNEKIQLEALLAYFALVGEKN